MPVGDCQRAFAAAARADGCVLRSGPRLHWLNRRGHLDLPNEALAARNVLERIFRMLGGDPRAQGAKSRTPLTGDLLHEPTGTLVEIDEHQHFTSHRLTTLDLYPTGSPLGFGPGGRQRPRLQRRPA